MEELNNFHLTQPTVEDEITVEVDRRLDVARKELDALWKKYLETEWIPWAKTDRVLKKIQVAYNILFSIYQKQQKLGEQFETVFSFGLLSWNAPTTVAELGQMTAGAEPEVNSRLGVEMARFFPDLPLGFFPDRGLTPIEALSGIARMSFSVVGNGGAADINFIVTREKDGIYTLTARKGVGVQDESTKYPRRTVSDPEQLPEALRTLMEELR